MLDASETVNIGTFHAFGGFSPSYWIGSRFAGRLADKLDGRIAVCGAARHFISRYFPGEYRIIPNGVDLDRFPSAEPFEELRDGTLNILFVGRLEERKGLTHLLQAYHRLRKRKVDARLLVIGERAEAARVQALRRPARHPRRRVSRAGSATSEKVRYFASADIFCAPNTGQESFGIVLLEAMAAGVPIVASDIHGFKRVVERNVQGILVEPRNPRALAAALYTLARDPDLRHEMGEAGRAARAGVQLGPRDRADRRLLLRDPRPRPRESRLTFRRFAQSGLRQLVKVRCGSKPSDRYRSVAPVGESASTPRRRT